MESLAFRIGDLPASHAYGCTFGYPAEHDFVRLRTVKDSEAKQTLRPAMKGSSQSAVGLFVCVQVFMKCLPSVSGNVWCFHL